MTRAGTERWIVRVLVGALFLAAGLFAVQFSIKQHEHLPSVALNQPSIYRVEVGLAVVYGGLLLLTPLFFGLVQGKLPVEISHRGAKWQEAANDTIEKLTTSVQTLQQESTDLRAKLVEQELQIRGLDLEKPAGKG